MVKQSLTGPIKFLNKNEENKTINMIKFLKISDESDKYLNKN